VSADLAFGDVDFFADGCPELLVAFDGIDVEAFEDSRLLLGTDALGRRLDVSRSS
jgi:hypothetical protein